MVLSLVPMSAFATAGTVPGGAISVDDTDTDAAGLKTVTVKLTQAAGTQITTNGMAKLTLNKGEFTGLATSKVIFDFGKDLDQNTLPQATVMPGLKADAAFADVAYLTVPAQYGDLVLSDDMDILVTFQVQFDEEDAGDITLAVEEMDDSNLDVAKAILIGTVDESTGGDMKLSVNDDTTKISFDGGELSKFTVSDIDENDKEDDKVVTLELELPDYLNWDLDADVSDLDESVASLGSSAILLKATGDDNIVTVDVTGQTKLDLLVKPFVTVDKRDASTGDITLKVTARNAAGKKLETVDAEIGSIVDFDVTM